MGKRANGEKAGVRGTRRRSGSDIKPGRAVPHYRRIKNPYPPIEALSADALEAIHESSLQVLKEVGVGVLLPEARAIFADAGADVDESNLRVRFEREVIETAIARIPSRVEMQARNPERNFVIGGPAVAFAAVGGPPNVSDLENGRRPGTHGAFEDLLRLSQAFDVIHMLSPSVEPLDVNISVRHLETTFAMLTLTDKVPFIFCRGSDWVADCFEMLRIAHGISGEVFAEKQVCYTVVNANSPLQLDAPMSQGIIDFARRGQLMILTPFTLAGAMAPVTLAGALVQQNAEALAGLCLAQLTRPGAPVAYGGFTSNVDMKSGAPAFGTPEYVKAAWASGQLARRYGVPFRSSNVNTSNTPDVQAAYESQMALWGALMGGCNILMHGAGWLEGGLTASFEKFIIDIEMLQMMAEVFQPIAVDKDALALEAVREVGPGGHFFGCAHTLARYSDAFYAPLLSDWRNFETWQEAGSVEATQRANRIYKDTLAGFEAPPIDAAVREELEAFVARRTSEGGVRID